MFGDPRATVGRSSNALERAAHEENLPQELGSPRTDESVEREGRETVNIENFVFEGVAKCYAFKWLERTLFEERLVKSPAVAFQKLEEARGELMTEMETWGSRPTSFPEEREREMQQRKWDVEYEYYGNTRRLDAGRAYLKAHGIERDEFDDEGIAEEYTTLLRSLYSTAFRALLQGNAATELNALRDAVCMLRVYTKSRIFYKGERDIETILRTVDFFLGNQNLHEAYIGIELPKNPGYGPAMKDFIQKNYERIEISDLEGDRLVYAENVGTFGMCKRKEDGSVSVELVMADSRPTTGSGMPKPKIEIEHVHGKAYPVAFDEGIPGNQEERVAMYESLPKALEAKGIHRMKTHIFASSFLFDAIAAGKWTIPHLKGFQLETREIEEGKTKEFEYFSRKWPYFTFIFNGEMLEAERPMADQKNRMKGFHFLSGGLPFAHPAFLYCVVPSGVRTKLLSWIRSMPPEEQTRIFGEKDISKFFVSEPTNL